MSVLANRDFRLLWIGQTISQVGSQITPVVLPLIAITTLKAGNAAVAGLVTAQFLPFLLIGLPAGAWVDRLARRPIMIVCDVARAVVLLSVPIGFALGHLSMAHLYTVAVLMGLCTVFFDVAYQTYLPELVEQEQLTDANTKLEVSRSGAQIVGPGLAGLLVSLIRAPLVVLADSVSFLFSALTLWSMRARRQPPASAPHDRRLLREIGEGLRFVLGNRTLATIMACTALLNLLPGGAMFALLIPFAVRELGISAGSIGLLLALTNLGFVAGALTAARIGRRLGIGRSLVLAVLVSTVGVALLPLAPRSHPAPFFTAGWMLAWFGTVLYNIHQVSLRQRISPPELLGRVNATMRFAVWGTIPIGSTLGGVLSGAIGLRATMWVCVAGGAAALAVIALSPLPRFTDVPPTVDEEGSADERTSAT